MKKILFSYLLVLLLSTAAFSQSNPTPAKTDFAVISFYLFGSTSTVSIIYSDKQKEEVGKFRNGDELNTKLVELYSKLVAEGFEFISETDTRITFIRKNK